MMFAALSGCGTLHQVRMGIGEQPTLVGPPVRDNRTPMDDALTCLAGKLSAGRSRPMVVAVGDVRDYTGKYSVNEGNAITQGGALMVSSALGKLGGAIGLAERFDPTIAERELGYTDRRQLGDGAIHDLPGPAASKVAWLPYYGGSIAASDYYIVGGVTELNYDIRSGGFDIGVDQTGPKARTYTQSVAIDLRIVDTRSLLVVKTVSLTKQFTGYEVGLNLFRFFGSSLFDINLGAKAQEPLQLGVRTALEEATLRLVAAAARLDPAQCLQGTPTSASPPGLAVAGIRPAPLRVSALNLPAPAGDASGQTVRVRFEPGSASLSGEAGASLGDLLAHLRAGPVDLLVLARDDGALERTNGSALADQRIEAVHAALRARGVPAASIKVVGRASGAGMAAGSGDRLVAQLRIG